MSDRFGGYSKSDKDIIIDGCRLILTCDACPEQYDVFDDSTGEKVGYLRLRGGWFRADTPDCGGETVYEVDEIGDSPYCGCFPTDDERTEQLTKAVAAIKTHRSIK
jgi:hypothetical protein